MVIEMQGVDVRGGEKCLLIISGNLSCERHLGAIPINGGRDKEVGKTLVGNRNTDGVTYIDRIQKIRVVIAIVVQSKGVFLCDSVALRPCVAYELSGAHARHEITITIQTTAQAEADTNCNKGK